jgi:hypothetical protein
MTKPDETATLATCHIYGTHTSSRLIFLPTIIYNKKRKKRFTDHVYCLPTSPYLFDLITPKWQDYDFVKIMFK